MRSKKIQEISKMSGYSHLLYYSSNTMKAPQICNILKYVQHFVGYATLITSLKSLQHSQNPIFLINSYDTKNYSYLDIPVTLWTMLSA